jgi:hypothetical protein
VKAKRRTIWLGLQLHSRIIAGLYLDALVFRCSIDRRRSQLRRCPIRCCRKDIDGDDKARYDQHARYGQNN